ncbi:hypothetical protein MTO96_026852 [Rhipicephalus appendiculatus]
MNERLSMLLQIVPWFRIASTTARSTHGTWFWIAAATARSTHGTHDKILLHRHDDALMLPLSFPVSRESTATSSALRLQKERQGIDHARRHGNYLADNMNERLSMLLQIVPWFRIASTTARSTHGTWFWIAAATARSTHGTHDKILLHRHDDALMLPLSRFQRESTATSSALRLQKERQGIDHARRHGNYLADNMNERLSMLLQIVPWFRIASTTARSTHGTWFWIAAATARSTHGTHDKILLHRHDDALMLPLSRFQRESTATSSALRLQKERQGIDHARRHGNYLADNMNERLSMLLQIVPWFRIASTTARSTHGTWFWIAAATARSTHGTYDKILLHRHDDALMVPLSAYHRQSTVTSSAGRLEKQREDINRTRGHGSYLEDTMNERLPMLLQIVSWFGIAATTARSTHGTYDKILLHRHEDALMVPLSGYQRESTATSSAGRLQKERQDIDHTRLHGNDLADSVNERLSLLFHIVPCLGYRRQQHGALIERTTKSCLICTTTL